MDRITNSFIEEFCTSFGFEIDNLMRKYELFTNYCIIAKHMVNTTFTNTLQDIVESNTYTDVRFDGFAVLLNGTLVSSQQEVDDILEINTNVKVEFIVIDTKSKIHGADVAQNLIENIKTAFIDILKEKDINEYADDGNQNLLQYILSKSTHFCATEPPVLYVYLVSDQANPEDAQICSDKLKEINEIFKGKGLFDKIITNIWSNQQLVGAYKKSKNNESISIKMTETPISLPKIDGAGDSYLAIVPFSEFKKLIIDENGAIKSSVFHDNIRAFQGDRPANVAMKKSLTEGTINEFIFKHNGITVIASSVTYGSMELRFFDYQIVNGCQTCHVLYNNRNVPGIDNLQLIVRAIGSTDKRLRNDIVMGTNSQTEVKREQLIALSEVQERIEDYYNSIREYERLYYERRSKQYISETKVPQNKVITIPIEIYSFVSMFLSEPHNVTGYYSQVVDNIEKSGKRVFSMDYKPDVYYTAGYTHYCLTKFLKEAHIPYNYVSLKYYIMYAFRLMATDNVAMPAMESDEIEAYCKKINATLSDKTTCWDLFYRAFDLIKSALGRTPQRNDNMSKALTSNVKNQIEKALEDNIPVDSMLKKLKSGGNYNFKTFGLHSAIESIIALTSCTKKIICIHAGNLYSNEMNDETVVQAFRRFLNLGGKLNLLVYNYDEEKTKDSPLFQMLAYMRSISKSIDIKRNEERICLSVGGERMLFNMFLFDGIHERLELQNQFTAGRIWINKGTQIASYQAFFDRNFKSPNSVEVDLVQIFNLNAK